MQRNQRQADVFAWAQAAFTVEQATSLPQRGLRLLEEAIEAFQATGGDPGMAHRLVDYVFARPVGELRQELGGVGIGVLALAAAAGMSADEVERFEVERVLGRPLEHFQRRNAEKNAAGFLVGSETNKEPANHGVSPARSDVPLSPTPEQGTAIARGVRRVRVRCTEGHVEDRYWEERMTCSVPIYDSNGMGCTGCFSPQEILKELGEIGAPGRQ